MSALEENDDGTVTGINVTPMVDIMMVLLIIFMVTANFVSQESLKVNLPKTAATDEVATASLTIVINAKGILYFRDTKTDLNNLRDALSYEVKANPDVKVTLAADDKLGYRQVIAVIDAIKLAGIKHVALAAQR
jgi:biopolymer transport protein ExbD